MKKNAVYILEWLVDGDWKPFPHMREYFADNKNTAKPCTNWAMIYETKFRVTKYEAVAK